MTSQPCPHGDALSHALTGTPSGPCSQPCPPSHALRAHSLSQPCYQRHARSQVCSHAHAPTEVCPPGHDLSAMLPHAQSLRSPPSQPHSHAHVLSSMFSCPYLHAS